MIKLHLLEKVMEVVTNVSRWAASIKNKKREKNEIRLEAKKGSRRRRHIKEQMPVEKKNETQVIHLGTPQVVSKAKVMKQWMSFIKEGNIIYLPSYPVRNQRQRLLGRDNVVYIDFDNLVRSELGYGSSKSYYDNEWYHDSLHARAPTHSF